MMKHEKSNNEKKIEIPDNQIVYDQRKVINQTIAIRRKRSLENKRRVAISKCINIVSFLLIAAAVLFLLRVLQIKEFGQINHNNSSTCEKKSFSDTKSSSFYRLFMYSTKFCVF